MQKHLAWGSLWAMLVIQVAGTCLTWFACVQISGESQKSRKTGEQHDGSIVRFACFLRFPEIFAMHATKTRSRTYVSFALWKFSVGRNSNSTDTKDNPTDSPKLE